MIYVSTGSVFAGTKTKPGPFTETDPPAENNQLNDYALSKKQAESYCLQNGGAIIRLSHPIGGRHQSTDQPDYLERLLQRLTLQQLFPLFTDVHFPISYLPDVASAVTTIALRKKTGIFHTVTTDCTSPVDLLNYALKLLNRTQTTIPTINFQAFRNNHPDQNIAQFYAMDGMRTRLELNLPPRTWKEAVEATLKNLPQHYISQT
jgi:dTDP-4-dehydrorhamnose reductase